MVNRGSNCLPDDLRILKLPVLLFEFRHFELEPEHILLLMDKPRYSRWVRSSAHYWWHQLESPERCRRRCRCFSAQCCYC